MSKNGHHACIAERSSPMHPSSVSASTTSSVINDCAASSHSKHFTRRKNSALDRYRLTMQHAALLKIRKTLKEWHNGKNKGKIAEELRRNHHLPFNLCRVLSDMKSPSAVSAYICQGQHY